MIPLIMGSAYLGKKIYDHFKNKGKSNSPSDVPVLGQDPNVSRGMDMTGDTLNNHAATIWDDYTGARQRDQDQYADINRGYDQFVNTGGYSPADIANLRARAIAPTRAVYSNAMNNITRQRNISGYSPNYTAAMSKLTRELAGSMSDASTDVNASIAQLVNQGKLAGLSGKTSLYGTTPAQTSMFGNQALQYGNQALDLQKLRNEYDIALKDYELKKKFGPNAFDKNLGRVKGVLEIGKGFGNMIGGWRS